MGLFEEGPQGLHPRASHDVKIELEGDWVRFSELTNSINLVLATAASQAQKKFAEEYAEKVKSHIRDGGKRFGYPRNEGDYLRRKQIHWASSTPMLVSGAMHNSIKVIQNARKNRYMVGIPKGLSRPDYWPSDVNKFEVHEYANISEHGFSTAKATVEPRPVFSDTFKKPRPDGMGGKSGLAEMVKFAIIGNYAKKHIRVKKIT